MAVAMNACPRGALKARPPLSLRKECAREFERLRQTIFWSVALLAPLLAMASTANAIPVSPIRGVLIPVPPVSGSTSTYVLGINDNNTIVGSYITSDGVQHGFFGSLSGSYTTFDVGVRGTAPRAINNSGYITGIGNSQQQYISYFEFERKPDGQALKVKNGGVALVGIPQGINSSNEFVGEYYDSADDIIRGYYGKSGKYLNDLSLPFNTPYTAPRGFNDGMEVVGWFETSASTYSGFLLSSGNTTVINNPNAKAVDTYLADINNNGLIAGSWDDQYGTYHAFLLDTSTQKFTSIKVPNAVYVEAFGLNSGGLVAVDADVGAYIYCSNPAMDCPMESGSVLTRPNHKLMSLRP